MHSFIESPVPRAIEDWSHNFTLVSVMLNSEKLIPYMYLLVADPMCLAINPHLTSAVEFVSYHDRLFAEGSILT